MTRLSNRIATGVAVALALGATLNGGQNGHPEAAASLAAPAALLALLINWRWSNHLLTSWALTTAMLFEATLLTLHGNGQPVFLLGTALAISVLSSYGDWRKLVFAAGLALLQVGLLNQWLSAEHALGASTQWAAMTLLSLQCGYLGWAAHREARRETERFDMEFLVRAMGSSGPIRLNFDALKVESELGKRFKHVQDRMVGTMRQVDTSTRGVQQAATILQRSGSELMQRTETSANGLRDAAMCLEQITLIVKTSAEATAEARQTANQASVLAESTGTIITKMLGQMREIDTSSRRITDIVSVIDGIAFQTNLLALNAAVEAARAGEQGRGFAVVAAEVRTLAKRVTEAAREVKTLLGASLQTIEEGNQMADVAGRNMDELVGSVRRVGDVFRNLSDDTDEHANSIDAVTMAVKELDEVVRRNLSVAEETQQVSHQLTEHAQGLSHVLSSFRLGDTMPPAMDTNAYTSADSAAPAAAPRPVPAPVASAARPPATAHQPARPANKTASPAPRPATKPSAASPQGGSADNVEFF